MKYCQGNPGSAEAVFGWSRSAVESGLTGIICIGAQAAKSGGLFGKKENLRLLKSCVRLLKIIHSRIRLSEAP
ncbi:MAG: hypothetical protein R2941_09135 [Desulfobacterales bacterium]